ncbi:MAG: patatin-like phospholipase family protein [Nitrosomonadales bacterium]|nr:patatin-like phospholipase family protein [Nitrosomonadales bacterium]
MEKRIGLILTGGGARAAYQVGVLKGIAEFLPRRARNPFPIICGTSAGALNAAVLAVNMGSFRKGVRHLDRIWKNFHADQVYRTDLVGVFNNSVLWLTGLILSGMGIHKINQVSLLDNTPLIELLDEIMPCEKIQEGIDAGLLHALSITASGYGSGQSVTFYQGVEEIVPWQGTRRIGVRTKIENKHLLASAALPFFFPAIQINREYFGDGSMRQIAPISSAMQLGATSILVIGVNSATTSQPDKREGISDYPSLAQIAGHALNSIFLDNMEVDLERVRKINGMVEIMPEELRLRTNLRQVDVLVITPSQSIEKIAEHYVKELPWTIRLLLRLIGTTHQSGATLVSYLLSEGKYCRTLIDLGYRDAMQRREEIQRFLDGQHRQDSEMPQ